MITSLGAQYTCWIGLSLESVCYSQTVYHEQVLPIGIQEFEKLRTGGYIYVDKTRYMAPLLAGGYYFFSRPRRFGKSLLVSTLMTAFEGKRELFEGLWLHHQHDFKVRPVIRLDFSSLDFREQPLQVALLKRFKETAQNHGFELAATTAKDAFKELILTLSEIERVVVLVDEYDKALTDYLDEPAKRQEHQGVLKGVYGLLKPLDAYIHLVFLTGVSKFGKLSLFSDLNNLVDISLTPQYASMLGYTAEELEANYASYLDNAAARLELSPEQLRESLRWWYNGYSWDGKNRLYCPYSMLVFLSNPVFKGYWYETGTPTFLVKLIKDQQINPLEFEGLETAEASISVADIDKLDPVSLMFQTGYLTIRHQEANPLGVLYELSYPNEEVRQAFSRQLLEEYTGASANKAVTIALDLQRALLRQDWDTFFKTINRTLASVPYQIFPEKESYFHSLLHVMLAGTGYRVASEVSGNRGRMDTVVELPDKAIIFEFKLDGSPQQAIQQIKDGGYASQYSKPVTLVGVVFDQGAKQVGEWAVE